MKEILKHETLTFDLHPLYASILKDGAVVRKGDVLGLDGDLRRVLIAPFDAAMRLLITGDGPSRRVKVFLAPSGRRRIAVREEAPVRAGRG